MGVTPPEGTTLEQYAAQLAAIASSAPWLPLSGGTMTGDLTVEGKLVFGGSNGPRVQVGPSNELQFNSASGGSVQFSNVQVGGTPTQNLDIVNKAYVDSKGPKTATVTLTTAGWRKREQTVTVTGILADSSAQIVDVCPANKPSADRWAAAGVWCTSQAANSLTFSCDSVPTEDINVNIRMQGVSA
jgi:hypothetical protein